MLRTVNEIKLKESNTVTRETDREPYILTNLHIAVTYSEHVFYVLAPAK